MADEPRHSGSVQAQDSGHFSGVVRASSKSARATRLAEALGDMPDLDRARQRGLLARSGRGARPSLRCPGDVRYRRLVRLRFAWHALRVEADPISIRRLEPRDWGGWRVLWDAYLDFYREALAEEVTTATFARLCDDDGDLFGLVAADGTNEPVGFAHLVFHASTWSKTTSCYMEDLFVAPRARGFDVGRRLIVAVYEQADRRGSTNVYWHTQEYNAPARSLYDTVAHRTYVVYER